MVKARLPFTVEVTLKQPRSNALIIGNLLEVLKDKGYDFQRSVIRINCQTMKVCSGTVEEVKDYMLPLEMCEHDLEIEYKLLTKKKQSSKVRERTIREVVSAVAEWRQLYVGKLTTDGEIHRHTLDEAAEIMGIPKKTLDDYFIQIQVGRLNNFDFVKHSDANIGSLRSFVQLHKKYKRKKK